MLAPFIQGNLHFFSLSVWFPRKCRRKKKENKRVVDSGFLFIDALHVSNSLFTSLTMELLVSSSVECNFGRNLTHLKRRYYSLNLFVFFFLLIQTPFLLLTLVVFLLDSRIILPLLSVWELRKLRKKKKQNFKFCVFKFLMVTTL